MALSGTVNGTVTYRSQYFTFYFTWSALQSVEGNYSDVTVKTYIKTTATSYTFDTVGSDRKHSITINGTTTSISKRINCDPWTSNPYLIQTATTRVYHNSDGSKSITISARSNGTASSYGYSASMASANDATASATIILDAIPRKSTLTVSNGTLETAQTLTADRKSTTFTHTLTWTSGSYSGTIATKSTATSWSFTPSADLANGAPNGNEVWVGFKLVTYNGDKEVGTYEKSVYMVIPETEKYAPSITGIVLADSDQTLYNKFGKFIQSKSKLSVSILYTGKYKSTIKSWSTTIKGLGTYSGYSFTTGFLNMSGNIDVTTTITDSRGRTNTLDSKIEVLAYTNPQAKTLTADRCDINGNLSDDGTYISTNCSWGISSLDNKNDKTVKLQWLNNDTWTDLSTLTGYSGTNVVSVPTTVFDEDKEYNIRLYVADYFSEATYDVPLGSSFTLFNYHESGHGLSIGKVCTKDNFFEVDLDTGFNKDIFDKYATKITNGVADSGSIIDPNTTLDHIIVTAHANCPSVGFWYVKTEFYSSKTTTSDRMQTAYPYSDAGNGVYTRPRYRYYISGVWSQWYSYSTSDNIVLYDNANGSNGSIVVNDSFENYSYIEIFYMDNNKKGFGSTKVYKPDGKEVHISLIQSGTSNVHIRSATYIIGRTANNTADNDAMTLTRNQYTIISSSTTSCSNTTNYIYIYRITGSR